MDILATRQFSPQQVIRKMISRARSIFEETQAFFVNVTGLLLYCYHCVVLLFLLCKIIVPKNIPGQRKEARVNFFACAVDDVMSDTYVSAQCSIWGVALA